MIIAGIDPGLKGAVALINSKGKVKVFPFPVITTKKGKKTSNGLDEKAIREILSKYKIKHIFLEKVHAMPGNGGCSMFNFGAGWGLLRGICTGLYIDYTLVNPQTWKKVVCAGMPKGDKKQSIIKAKKLFPGVNLLPTPRCTKDSDGIADAVCIAEYGRRLLSTSDK